MSEIPSIESIEALLSTMSDDAKALLDSELEGLREKFKPTPGPQTDAYLSDADLVLYGGQAGGGKSALEVGLAALDHREGIIFRREGTQLDGLIKFSYEVFEGIGKFNKKDKIWEWVNSKGQPCSLRFAGLPQADDWRKHAGNARDYMAFDEAGEFLRDQIFQLLGWLRTTIPGQRTRVLLGSNPPRGGDGDWMLIEFGPWLDPLHPHYGAKAGELRWAISMGDTTEWVEGPGYYERNGEEVEALSRTFIPAALSDNPYLMNDKKYKAKLQALPEPLRSQLLYGNFMAGREDDAWQIIPSEWVELAMQRWDLSVQAQSIEDLRRAPMTSLAADVAQGGKDNTVLAMLHDLWFDKLVIRPGAETKTGKEVGDLMMSKRRNGSLMAVDATGGWGGDTIGYLKRENNIRVESIVYSSGTGATSAGTDVPLSNVRTEMYWRFREALNPLGGELICLPRSAMLKTQLTAGRWFWRKNTIAVEPKEDIIARIGFSPDEADAVVMAWYKRKAGIQRLVKGGAAPKVNHGRNAARKKYGGQKRR